MIKGKWLSAGSYILIPSRLGLVISQLCPHRICTFCPANGKQRHVVLTNKKQDNFDKIHADNVQWRWQICSNPYLVLDLCQLGSRPLTWEEQNIEKPDIYFSSRSSTREYFPYLLKLSHPPGYTGSMTDKYASLVIFRLWFWETERQREGNSLTGDRGRGDGQMSEKES